MNGITRIAHENKRIVVSLIGVMAYNPSLFAPTNENPTASFADIEDEYDPEYLRFSLTME